MKYTDIIREAVDKVDERGKEYGGVKDCFTASAEIASAILGKPITKAEVALVLHAVKLARLRYNPAHADSWVDGVNYVAFAGEFSTVDLSDLTADFAKHTEAVPDTRSFEEWMAKDEPVPVPE